MVILSVDSIPTNIFIQDFRDLIVWQKAVNLSDEIYEIVEGFPDYEKYIMVSQIIRCTTSISANIAEGNSQLYSKKEFSFANNALGSAGETKHWLEMAYRRKYIDDTTYYKLIEDTDEVIRMLIGYMKKLKGEIKN
jgi:four helix bundle protein